MAERARSTPPVRKLAHDLGIDLEQLQGSGTGGAVTRDDVEAAFAERFGEAGTATSAGQASAAQASAAPPVAGQAAPTARATTAERAVPDENGETRIPIHGVRKHTAAAMVQSAFTAPHVSCFLTVDVGRSVELLAELRAERTADGPKIGILALVAQAVCLAARRTPELNAHWDEAAQQIVQYRSVHLGIAAATPRGLMVPVIADAQAMGLAELATAIAGLSEAARAGTTTPQALRGGTFSISNIGVFGVDAGTPILNPGEAGILAIGCAAPRATRMAGRDRPPRCAHAQPQLRSPGRRRRAGGPLPARCRNDPEQSRPCSEHAVSRRLTRVGSRSAGVTSGREAAGRTR